MRKASAALTKLPASTTAVNTRISSNRSILTTILEQCVHEGAVYLDIERHYSKASLAGPARHTYIRDFDHARSAYSFCIARRTNFRNRTGRGRPPAGRAWTAAAQAASYRGGVAALDDPGSGHYRRALSANHP